MYRRWMRERRQSREQGLGLIDCDCDSMLDLTVTKAMRGELHHPHRSVRLGLHEKETHTVDAVIARIKCNGKPASSHRIRNRIESCSERPMYRSVPCTVCISLLASLVGRGKGSS